MSADLSNALPLILLGLFLLVVGIWVISRSLRKAKIIEDGAPPLARDVLDEGAQRAQRNQALIDSAPAAAVKVDTVSAAANTQAVAAAPLGTDAEAGPVITPTVATPAPKPAPTQAPAPAQAPAETPATEMGAEIAPELADSPAAAASPDDLARIKGVGPKLVSLLGELGITSYAQIAAWGDADIERVDAQLGRFKGRITRDQWVEQAKLLCAGDEAAFTDKFGRNG
jgi:predicted flap endonuclease-1-like 5' DNA nuclease